MVERQQGIKQSSGKRPRGQTSRPLPGRAHVDVQTGNTHVPRSGCTRRASHSPQTTVTCLVLEPYLYEMSDIIETSDTDCQTDPFLDIPSAPLFQYAKIGNDAGTVIEEGEVGGPKKGSGHSYGPSKSIN